MEKESEGAEEPKRIYIQLGSQEKTRTRKNDRLKNKILTRKKTA